MLTGQGPKRADLRTNHRGAHAEKLLLLSAPREDRTASSLAVLEQAHCPHELESQERLGVALWAAEADPKNIPKR